MLPCSYSNLPCSLVISYTRVDLLLALCLGHLGIGTGARMKRIPTPWTSFSILGNLIGFFSLPRELLYLGLFIRALELQHL